MNDAFSKVSEAKTLQVFFQETKVQLEKEKAHDEHMATELDKMREANIKVVDLEQAVADEAQIANDAETAS